MTKQVKVVLSDKGIQGFLKGSEVQSYIDKKVKNIAQRANSMNHGEFIGDTQVGKSRIVGMVKPKDAHGYFGNKKHNILLKSMDAGRG
jgi:hypothetical protein